MVCVPVQLSSLELLLEPSEGVSREGLCQALDGRGQHGGLQLHVPTPDHLTQGTVHRKKGTVNV